jgi:hypothetical protein
LSCRADVKLEALRVLATELRAVVLPSSVEPTRAVEGAVTTMLTATLESSRRRPSAISADLAAAVEVAAADEDAVRTGSPTYKISMPNRPAVVLRSDSLSAASSVALDGMERPSMVNPTDTTATAAEGADVGLRVGFGVRA